jgi:hypothetical protein
VGGVEDHPLFAEALLQRALSFPRDPARETVILVAHGDGEDGRDAHWRGLLASLAGRMREKGGSAFRAIRSATCGEDWPEKRAPAVEQVRAFVRGSDPGGHGRAARRAEPRSAEGQRPHH